jgi:putative glutamine amidotransferase
MTRPRIGLTLDVDAASDRYELKRAYVDAVQRAGGLPVPLPHADDPGVVAGYLELLDGVVITGGAFDIPPEMYGAARRAELGPIKDGRTRFEWAVCERALEGKVPLLGVCGGMQLLNVVRGGTLWQDLVAELGVASHEQPAPKDRPTHAVQVEPGSLLARLVGPAPLPANTTHHQAVRDPGRGVVISGRAADGVIEAIELPDLPFVLGVQWHPEGSARSEPRHEAIYRGLVEAASK